MKLYFSDWTSTQNILQMEKKGFPHIDRLIKVFATENDPSIILKRPIKTLESRSDPFDQPYSFPGRGPWLAEELEGYLNHFRLTGQAKDKCRALFRFAFSPEMEIAQLAMNIRNTQTGDMHYSHPLRIIDGLDEALSRDRNYGLHLDVFTPRSIERLKKHVNLDDGQILVGEREAIILEKMTAEGSSSSKEGV